MARTATLPILNGESGLSRYLAEIRKFPMLEPQQEYMFAKRWREHDDREAAHHLVTSHLRLVANIAMGHRGYGVPHCGGAPPGRQGPPTRHLRHLVDQGLNTRVHPAFVVARENGHHREPEEAVLQPARPEEHDLVYARRRSPPRPGQDTPKAPRRYAPCRDRRSPIPRWSCVAQRTDPRRR